jgi:hypothetical protein
LESDYNILYCESGTPIFKCDPPGNQRDLTISQWQVGARVYEATNVIITPDSTPTPTTDKMK